MHRSSPYGYQFGKGRKDYGKNKFDPGGKGRTDYGKGSMSSIIIESQVERISHLENTSEKLQLENDLLKEDYQALLENERLLEVDFEIMQLENNRLQSENCRLQSDLENCRLQPVSMPIEDTVCRLQAEVDRLQIEFDCMVAANTRLRRGIVKHAEQAKTLEYNLNELAYPQFATKR